MGDIAHGWAAAEFVMLLRDILFFEADEDGGRHIFLAPGVLPHWLGDGETVSVRAAPTIFGGVFGYRLRHDAGARELIVDITQPPPVGVSFVLPCRFGAVRAATADGQPVPITGTDVSLPAGLQHAVIRYT